ncbi:MAG: hypothetical protein Tsb006_5090 [Rickettsiaceae bacterium]
MTKNKTNAEQLFNISVGELANYSPVTLYELLNDANGTLNQAKKLKSWIEGAVAVKYFDRFKQERMQTGKEIGVVHIEDNGIKISCNVPKKIEWHQQKLSQLFAEIAASGSDPYEYIDLIYKISESKFSSWPKSMQQLFISARNVTAGTAGYKLIKLDGAR